MFALTSGVCGLMAALTNISLPIRALINHLCLDQCALVDMSVPVLPQRQHRCSNIPVRVATALALGETSVFGDASLRE